MWRINRLLVVGVSASLLLCGASLSAANLNGRAGTMPAYYDDQLLTINFSELPTGGEACSLVHNKSINVIYQSDACMPNGNTFVSVLDAIHGDGVNPLWQEVQVIFDNPDFRCQQLTSAANIAVAAAVGLVTLQPTDEIYRCAVIGPKR